MWAQRLPELQWGHFVVTSCSVAVISSSLTLIFNALPHPSEFCSLVPPVLSTLVLQTSRDTAFRAAKRAKNSNNEQTTHLQITAAQQLSGDLSSCLSHTTGPCHLTSPSPACCSLMQQLFLSASLSNGMNMGGTSKFMVLGHFMLLDLSETPLQGCGEESVPL